MRVVSGPGTQTLALIVIAALCQSAIASENDFFERKIRPVLVQHCYECHAGDADVIQGGLRLDDRASMMRGGDSGTALIPGEPNHSLLLSAIRYDDLEMPPDGPLGDQVVRDFETWIKLGAVDSRKPHEPSVSPLTTTPDIDWQQARSFWSFQPPQRHDPPRTSNPSWSSNRIDSFVMARLDGAQLQPNPAAKRGAFIRRVTFDLTGLPPSPEAVERYIEDDHPLAKQRLVDRLLSTAAHAERWARLWLDVARYAEDQAHKVGSNDSLTYPNAYRYRDWVINALSNDVPYDEFIRLQLAADLVYPEDPESHLALGFLGLGPKYYRRSSPEVMADEWEDRIDTVSRGLLGLTVACARCHDHKYDPIPTSDYYALAGVFAGTEMFNRPLSASVETEGEQAKKPQDAVHIVREGTPQDLNVMIRGDAGNLGPKVERGFLQVLCSEPVRFTNQSGRGDLAEAIVDQNNPLTARVIVNRVWRALTGQALVSTPSNFGALGETPTHPELLDDLAARYVNNGWSLKWLQREIVLSSTYGQSSAIDSAKAEVDPGNRLLWRIPRRRLSVEGFRDALLAASGRLDRSVGGPSTRPDEADSRRRTIYSEVSRMDLNPMLARFDFPDPNAHSAARIETTTPLQKLFLLNSPFLVRQADALADRLLGRDGPSGDRIKYAYRLVYGRPPSADELSLGKTFVKGGDHTRWSEYAQALLISNEMFMVD